MDSPSTETLPAQHNHLTTLHPHQPEPSTSSPLSSAPDDSPSPNVTDLHITSSPRKRSSPSPEPSKTLDTDTTMANTSSSTGPAKKKAKLTDAEKEEREREKVEKEKEREARAKEKEAKAKERAAKQAEKDEKKRLKDEEKRKKEEEVKKKEKAQPRLNAFFKMPASSKPATAIAAAAAAAPIAASSSPVKSQAAPALVDPIVIDAPNDAPSDAPSPVPPQPPVPPTISDFDKYFQPFFVKPNVVVANLHSFTRDDLALEVARKTIDQTVCDKSTNTSDGDAMELDTPSISSDIFASLLHIPPHKRRPRGRKLRYNTKEILSALNASPEPVIDLTGEKDTTKPNYLALLKSLPKKHLHFAEDVRPPYRGTFTRIPTTSSLLRGRNPFSHSLPGINYDYDSESEWIEAPEEEEGEELLSEGDEEEGEDMEEDMDEFLDDEADELARNRRNAVLGPMVAVNTGMIWEDEQGDMSKWEGMRIGYLLENVSGPINPFSDSYWPKKERKVLATKASATIPANPFTAAVLPTTSSMAPPPSTSRPPLTTTKNGETKVKKSHARIADEDMADFRKAVEGSDLTKTGLIEVLKKQFPKSSKEAIRDTLGSIAARVGLKEADKRWVLLANPL